MSRTRQRQLWTQKERRLLREVRLETSQFKAIVLTKRLFAGRVSKSDLAEARPDSPCPPPIARTRTEIPPVPYRGGLREATAGHVMVENTSGAWPDALERRSRAATRTIGAVGPACRWS